MECRIFWSTQSGRAKACARRTARILQETIGEDEDHDGTPLLTIQGGSIGAPFDSAVPSFLDLLATSKTQTTLFVLFVSTTGDGEHCETIKNTWQQLLSKTLYPNQCFANNKNNSFALFCLGDRAYGPQFCAGGRKLAVRLLQLGVPSYCAVGYGDDQTPNGGVLQDLDTWLQTVLLPTLLNSHKNARPNNPMTTTGDNTKARTGTRRKSSSLLPSCPYRVSIVPPKKEDEDDKTTWETEYLQDAYTHYFTERGPITAYSYECRHHQNDEDGLGDEDRRTIQRVVTTTTTEEDNNRATTPNKSRPLLGTVVVNERITAPDWQQNTRHLEIALTTTPKIEEPQEEAEGGGSTSTTAMNDRSATERVLPYHAGDVATIVPFNSAREVTRFLRVLPPSIAQFADTTITIELEEQYVTDNRYTHWPTQCTLRGWLTYCADLQTLPEREDLRALSAYCGTPKDSSETNTTGLDQGQKLCAMSDTAESALYGDYILREKRTWSDVFYDFDTLRQEEASQSRLTLDALFVLLPPIRPRDFSIASAPTMDRLKQHHHLTTTTTTKTKTTTNTNKNTSSFSIELCIAVVEGTTRRGRSYHGLCSEFLAHIPPTLIGTTSGSASSSSSNSSRASSSFPSTSSCGGDAAQQQRQQKLLVWIKPGTFGKLPLQLHPTNGKQPAAGVSFDVPILCIGAGTGIAPMRSLMLERMAVRYTAQTAAVAVAAAAIPTTSTIKKLQIEDESKIEETNTDVVLPFLSSGSNISALACSSSTSSLRTGNISMNGNENILIYGSRKKTADFYYQKEWEMLSNSNNARSQPQHIRLLTAFSQDQNHKLYVQKVLREADDGTLIAKHILEAPCGAIYIAGNPKMARAVKQEIIEALTDVLVSTPGTALTTAAAAEKHANKILNKMQRMGRFSIEAW